MRLEIEHGQDEPRFKDLHVGDVYGLGNTTTILYMKTLNYTLRGNPMDVTSPTHVYNMMNLVNGLLGYTRENDIVVIPVDAACKVKW